MRYNYKDTNNIFGLNGKMSPWSIPFFLLLITAVVMGT